MKKLGIIIFITFLNLNAQIEIEFINDVPANFKEKYFNKPRNYNPLQVGNIWQYLWDDFGVIRYSTIKVLQDSIINGKKYYKKLFYPEFTNNTEANIVWERNDTVSGVTFMLDFQDLNENGDTLDELPVDSLENPYQSSYKSYKYANKNPNSTFGYEERTVVIDDTSWVIIEGDTVISRYFQILELFWGEQIADKYGIIFNSSESPIRWISGAVIAGKQYGTIVDVKDISLNIPKRIHLSQNYPNPFNPSTTISYEIPSGIEHGNQNVRLIVYDILGKKIQTLVNKKQKPGNYNVFFNGSKLTSGIYFYSLFTDFSKITKSMILIK